jgi:hypothetical protein
VTDFRGTTGSVRGNFRGHGVPHRRPSGVGQHGSCEVDVVSLNAENKMVGFHDATRLARTEID